MKWFSSKKDPAPGAAQSEAGLMAMGDRCMQDGKYELAFHSFVLAAQQYPNERAAYNAAAMLALGQGTEQNFVESAYWFRQSALRGNEKAQSLMLRSVLDELKRLLEVRTPPAQYYQSMVAAVKRIFGSQDPNPAQTAARYINDFGYTFFKQKNYGAAAHLFRIAAEFGNYGLAQNMLGVLFNAGAGVPQNDLVALYWFDKAHDNGIKEATPDRFGIFNAYSESLSAEEFTEYMQRLAGWCRTGSPHIPQDPAKADFWMKTAK